MSIGSIGKIFKSWGAPTPNTKVQQTYDFSSEEDLSTYFRHDKWEELSAEQKLALFQEMENRRSAEYGLLPSKTINLADDDINGYYNNNKNKIAINLEQSSLKTLDTYYHECTHKLQNVSKSYMVECQNSIGAVDEIIIRSEITPGIYEDTLSSYRTQRCELDANNNAFLETVNFARANNLCSDVEYEAYIHNRNDYFNSTIYYKPGIKYEISQFRSDMNDLSELQLGKAKQQGIISEYEYNSALASIRSQENTALLNRVAECAKLSYEEKQNIENGIYAVKCRNTVSAGLDNTLENKKAYENYIDF